MSLGLCVLVRDRQDSICVRFARAGLFCAGSPLLCRIAGPAAFCRVRRILFFPFFRVFRSIMSIVRRGRGTRRACRTLQFDQGSDRCAWCLSMGANAPAVCTYKACGTQAKFIGTACVRRACFGHMVASVWDGSHVRQENKDRLGSTSSQLIPLLCLVHDGFAQRGVVWSPVRKTWERHAWGIWSLTPRARNTYTT